MSQKTYTCFRCGYSLLRPNQMKWVYRSIDGEEEDRHAMFNTPSLATRVWTHVCTDQYDCLRRSALTMGRTPIEAIVFHDTRTVVRYEPEMEPPPEPRYIMLESGLVDIHEVIAL